MSTFLPAAIVTAFVFFVALSLPPPSFFIHVRRSLRATRRTESPDTEEIHPAGRTLYIYFGVVVVCAIILLSASMQFYIKATIIDSNRNIVRDHLFFIIDSPDLTGIAFGSSVGLLFAYWLQKLWRRKSNQPPTYSEIAIACALLIFFLIGTGGGDLLRSVTSTISALKVAGTEISFASQSRQGDREQPLPTLVPPNPTTGSTATAPDASGALKIVSEVHEAARRDALYFALHSKLTTSQKINDLSESVNKTLLQSEETIQALKPVGAMGKCLNSLVQMYGDDGQIGILMANTARSLRSVLYIHGLYSTEEPKDLPAQLAKLLEELWQSARSNIPALDKNGASTDRTNNPCASQIVNEALRTRADLFSTLNANKSVLARPYLWSAAAAGLAFNHDYPAALSLLHDWIRAAHCSDHDELTPKPGENCRYHASRFSDRQSLSTRLRDIYEVRLRFLIANYIDEWTTFQPSTKTQAVISYQLRNLERTIDLLSESEKDTLDSMKLDNLRSSATLRKAEFCFDDETWVGVSDFIQGRDEESRKLSPSRIRFSLISTLISAKRTWIEYALLSDRYYKDYRYTARRWSSEIGELNLDCLAKAGINANDPDGKRYLAVEKAQNAIAIGRVQKAELYAPFLKIEKSDLDRQINDAIRKNADAIATLAPYSEQRPITDLTSSFVTSISSDNIFVIRGTLEDLLRDLRSNSQDR